jgi:hypothetical protein
MLTILINKENLIIEKKEKHYPGIEPNTFGVAVGDDNHCTIQAGVATKPGLVVIDCIEKYLHFRI